MTALLSVILPEGSSSQSEVVSFRYPWGSDSICGMTTIRKAISVFLFGKKIEAGHKKEPSD
jgi:hypothetical protein